MLDCFGLDMDAAEYENWQQLTGNQFAAKGSGYGGFTMPAQPTPLAGYRRNKAFQTFTLPLPSDDYTDKRVLELGCGAGGHGEEVVVRGGEYVGIDLSRFALECARFAAQGWAGLTYMHTIEDRPTILALAGTFDVVFGTNFFIHQPTDRTAAMFAFAGTMLRPDGYFSVDRNCGPARESGPQLGLDWRGFWRTREEEEALLEACGLEVQYHHVVPKPGGEPTREYTVAMKREDLP